MSMVCMCFLTGFLLDQGCAVGFHLLEHMLGGSICEGVSAVLRM